MCSKTLGEKMKARSKKINKRLMDLGKPLGISEVDAIKAKRTVKNIMKMSFVAGAFLLLGSIIAPGGIAGNFYGGGSIKDFKILLGGWL